jgi:hypothetical protein
MIALRAGVWSVGFRLLAAITACGIGAGCVSGGFMTTRTVAKWLNSQNIVLRVVLYVFIWPVFLITMLADEVIFNTIDFWSGKVTAQNSVFEKDGVRVQVAHSLTPLRRSVFTIDGKNGEHSIIELRESALGSIEVYKDGQKRTEVKDIRSAFPTYVSFENDGRTPAWTRALDVESLRDLETLPVQEGYARTVAQLPLAGVELNLQMACSK